MVLRREECDKLGFVKRYMIVTNYVILGVVVLKYCVMKLAKSQILFNRGKQELGSEIPIEIISRECMVFAYKACFANKHVYYVLCLT